MKERAPAASVAAVEEEEQHTVHTSSEKQDADEFSDSRNMTFTRHPKQDAREFLRLTVLRKKARRKQKRSMNTNKKMPRISEEE